MLDRMNIAPSKPEGFGKLTSNVPKTAKKKKKKK
jgi:hypothetical protein